MSVMQASDRIARARIAKAEWAKRTTEDRVRTLARLRKQLAADRDSLVNAVVADTEKPALDALAGDVLVTLEQMLYYEHRAMRILAPKGVGRSALFFAGTRFSEHYEPHGVVLVFGPANYPLQLSLVPTMTALYAGNAVLLKVSERTPAVAHAIEDLVRASGIPDGLVQVMCAPPEESIGLIDAGPDFVFFTGSSVNGKSVASRAAARGIPTLLELGGNDAAVVFADCDFARTIEGIVYGAFSNAGQVCVGTKRLYVQESLYERFVDELVRRTAALRVGAGQDVDLGRLPSESARRLLNEQVQDALTRGASLLTGSPSGGDRPIVLSHVPAQARLLREESFGPVLCVQSFGIEAEAVTLANASPFALGASVWSLDVAKAQRVAHALNAGNCSINDVIRSIANPAAGFGGNAASGYGRYHGAHGLQAFSRTKTIMENRSTRRREINWFPFTRKTYRRLDTLIELRHRPCGIVTAIRRILGLVLLTAVLSDSGTLFAETAHLILRVQLPARAHGRVAYLVFASPDGFPQNKLKTVRHGFSQPVGMESAETIDAGELAPGRYAVSVYLDENDNGKLDTGFFGIPKEPVGVSNNPRPRMGPPHFEDGVFAMGTATQTLTINLVRP